MVTYKIGAEAKKAEEKQTETLPELIMCLLDSSTITHIMHWQTESYAAHKALGKYYETMPELLDDVIEAYQGKKDIILRGFISYMESYEQKTPLEYMEYLSQKVTNGRALFGDDSEIQNLVDAIADLIDSTMYKLRRFK